MLKVGVYVELVLVFVMFWLVVFGELLFVVSVYFGSFDVEGWFVLYVGGSFVL